MFSRTFAVSLSRAMNVDDIGRSEECFLVSLLECCGFKMRFSRPAVVEDILAEVIRGASQPFEKVDQFGKDEFDQALVAIIAYATHGASQLSRSSNVDIG